MLNLMRAIFEKPANRLRGAALAGEEERGSAIVELALLTPVLFALMIGSAELGRLAYYSIEVSNAAYSGAAYAALNHHNPLNTSAISTIASSDASNIATVTTALTTSCACSNGTTVTCANAQTNCTARIFEYVTVTSTATISPMFNYPGISNTWTLTGQETMKVQQ